MPREPRYSFRSVARADLPMLRRWLAEPHVRRWWGDPDREAELIAADIELPGVDLNVVSFEGEPFAYIQSWSPHLHGLFNEQPAGTRGIDPFIGVPAMTGKGHGRRFIGSFVERLFERGAPRVTIDPDPANVIAVRAYEKAGFRRLDYRLTPDGLVALMARDRLTERER